MKKATHICFLAKKKQIFNSIINGRRGIDLSSLGCLFTNSRPRFITTEHQQFPLGISDCYVRRILNNSSYPVCIIPSSAIERYFIPCCNHQPPRSESFTFNINWCNNQTFHDRKPFLWYEYLHHPKMAPPTVVHHQGEIFLVCSGLHLLKTK